MKESDYFVIPSNPADREKILKVFQTISESYAKIDAERNLIKDEISALSKKFDIPKRFLSKMSKTYYHNNFKELINENDYFEMFYKSLIGMKNE